MHREWIIRPRFGSPLRIVRWTEVESSFQESHSSHQIDGIMDALSHDEPLAAEIYHDLTGHASRDHGPIDHRAWEHLRRAFLQGHYVLASPNVGAREGRLYTDDPKEVPKQKTPVSIPKLIAALSQVWPQLNGTGLRVLAAQYVHETDGGRSCYNWNLGNMKSPKTLPHMYLATPEGSGVNRRQYRPPDPTTRFRAFHSLEEGAQQWTDYHRHLAARRPDYLTALNAGDLATVAHILGPSGVVYFTDNETVYADALQRRLREVDSQLGSSH